MNWDTLNKKAGGTTPTVTTSSWDRLNTQAQQKAKVYNAQFDAAQSQKAADELNSFTGLAKETAKGVYNETLKPIVSSVTELPGKIRENVAAGVSDIKAGKPVTGAVKAYGRSLGDFLGTVFSPISTLLGLALKQTGGQTLLDNTGKVIADHNGITDWPAFQKFAMTHPNAGADFERIMNIALATFGAPIDKGAKTVSLKTESVGGENRIPVSTPNSRYSAYLKSQGYEPYVPNEQLPTIPMGSKPKGVLPTIQLNENISPSVPEGMKLVPADLPKYVQSFTNKIIGNAKPPEAPTVTDWQTFNEQAKANPNISQTSLKIQQQAKKIGIDIPTSELAMKDFYNRDTETLKAQEIIRNNPEAARAAIESPTPTINGVTPQTLFRELTIKAINEGNVNDILNLSRMKIGTESGRGLQALDTGIRLDANPAQALKDIHGPNIEKFNKTIKEITPKLEKIKKPTSQSFNDFLNEITC